MRIVFRFKVCFYLRATTTASGDAVVVVVVVVVGSWEVVRITRQWDNVNDRVATVDVRASQEKTSESHLFVEVVLQQGRAGADRGRGQAVAAQLFRARVDDRLLVDDLGGTRAGGLQIRVELVPVEVEQRLGG